MEHYYQERKVKCLHEIMRNIIGKNPRWVLDVGSGEGLFLEIMKNFNRNFNSVGLDLAILCGFVAR